MTASASQTEVLLVDAGNSRLKWASYGQGKLEPGEPVIYQSPFQGPSLASLLSTAWLSLAEADYRPTRLLVSNVAGPWILDALNQWIAEYFGHSSVANGERSVSLESVVAREKAFGVKNAYDQPELLGADRWAGLVAARHLIPGNCCIIDCGSALTIDVLTEKGEHKGGTITPGWDMMKKSLAADTDAIDHHMISKAPARQSLLGATTREAVDAGIAAACAGAVRHVVERYQDQSGANLHCVITGGGAPQLLPVLKDWNPEGGFQHEPDWVLKGLAIISDESVSAGDQ